MSIFVNVCKQPLNRSSYHWVVGFGWSRSKVTNQRSFYKVTDRLSFLFAWASTRGQDTYHTRRHRWSPTKTRGDPGFESLLKSDKYSPKSLGTIQSEVLDQNQQDLNHETTDLLYSTLITLLDNDILGVKRSIEVRHGPH